jgi:hypothetical protein
MFVTKEEIEDEMVLRMTQARDYGILRIWLNDEVIVPEYNGYYPKVRPMLLNVGKVNVPFGINTLTIETIGKDEGSENNLWGIDYFRIGGTPLELEEVTDIYPLNGDEVEILPPLVIKSEE